MNLTYPIFGALLAVGWLIQMRLPRMKSRWECVLVNQKHKIGVELSSPSRIDAPYNLKIQAISARFSASTERVGTYNRCSGSCMVLRTKVPHEGWWTQRICIMHANLPARKQEVYNSLVSLMSLNGSLIGHVISAFIHGIPIIVSLDSSIHKKLL